MKKFYILVFLIIPMVISTIICITSFVFDFNTLIALIVVILIYLSFIVYEWGSSAKNLVMVKKEFDKFTKEVDSVSIIINNVSIGRETKIKFSILCSRFNKLPKELSILNMHYVSTKIYELRHLLDETKSELAKSIMVTKDSKIDDIISILLVTARGMIDNFKLNNVIMKLDSETFIKFQDMSYRFEIINYELLNRTHDYDVIIESLDGLNQIIKDIEVINNDIPQANKNSQ